jgi:hypothetical protein
LRPSKVTPRATHPSASSGLVIPQTLMRTRPELRLSLLDLE